MKFVADVNLEFAVVEEICSEKQDVRVKRERVRKLLENFKNKLKRRFVVVSDSKVRFTDLGGLG